MEIPKLLNSSTEASTDDSINTTMVSLETLKTSFAIYTTIGLLSLCGGLAILTNSAVLAVGVCSSRNIFDLPIISLALVDFLTGIFGAPLLTVIYYLKLHKLEAETFGSFRKFKFALPNSVKYCTCYHLLYITGTRLLKLRRVITKMDGVTGPIFTKRTQAVHLAFIWLASLACSFISPLVENDVPEWCDRVFQKVEVWIFIVLPITITIIFDIIIFFIANKFSRNRNNSTKSLHKKMLQNVAAAKTTGLIILALVISYLPLVVKWMMCGLDNLIFSLAVQVLVAANSFANPFIYAYKIPAFRKELSRLLMHRQRQSSSTTISRRMSQWSRSF